MKYERIPLAKLQDDQLKQLAQLHHSVMHTLLADLGLHLFLFDFPVARHRGFLVSRQVEIFPFHLGRFHQAHLIGRNLSFELALLAAQLNARE